MHKKVDQEELLLKIAFTQIPQIGDLLAKRLYAVTGNIRDVFKLKAKDLSAVQGIGTALARQVSSALKSKEPFRKAEAELKFMQKNQIEALFFLDDNYPRRLSHCDDCPVLIYRKGQANYNATRVLGIVGTRRATSYGTENCFRFIEDFTSLAGEVLMVSGMALGIDIAAHKAAVKSGQPTIGVLAHGLDRIYPWEHQAFAAEMLEKGGAFITEFPSGTEPDKPNFVKRNRIIAGLSDAVLVIESGPQGGALITADIANSYNRDVFALPGRNSDPMSKGCNQLIRNNQAALVENAADLVKYLSWQENKKACTQRRLLFDVSPEEQIILKVLLDKGDLPVDLIGFHTGLAPAKLSAILLNLEFAGIVRVMPGKVYSTSGEARLYT
jgi:DNA processing protein